MSMSVRSGILPEQLLLELSSNKRIDAVILSELKGESLELKRKYGWGKRKIARALGISENTVRSWICYDTNPLAHCNIPSLSPSSGLSYIIGVVQGDGSCGRYRNGKWHDIYEVKLASVKDKEFALAFYNSLLSILRNGKAYIYSGKDGYWNAKVRSKILVNFLMDDSACQEVVEVFPADFIRGFFDSEGNAYSRGNGTAYIKAYNTNLFILQFLKDLLKEKFGLHSSISQPEKGEGHKGKKPVYVLGIYEKKSVETYLSKISFSIKRKRLWM